MQHEILINVIIFVAYVLNLPLNTLRSHSRSQRAGKWSLIMAHDRRPIYRAPTYIAVPMLGPHQPRYIGLTLYHAVWLNLRQADVGNYMKKYFLHLIFTFYLNTDASVIKFSLSLYFNKKRRSSMRSVLTQLLRIETVSELLDCGRKSRNYVHIDTY